jgi:hypothetical protein
MRQKEVLPPCSTRKAACGYTGCRCGSTGRNGACVQAAFPGAGAGGHRKRSQGNRVASDLTSLIGPRGNQFHVDLLFSRPTFRAG